MNARDVLPGTGRFVRASFCIDAVQRSDDLRVAAAATFSAIRHVSVPSGISVPGAPDLATTR